jgi:hypothetical protein
MRARRGFQKFTKQVLYRKPSVIQSGSIENKKGGKEMRELDHALPAETFGNDTRETRMSLVEDSLGEGARQLALLLALATVAHLASSLLLRR